VQEVDEPGEVGALVVIHREVAAIRAEQETPGWQPLGHHLHMRWIHGVVAGADYQRGYLD
jgi:hypothetical protein